MAIGKDGAVLRQLRTLFDVGAIGELTDGQLLRRFATDGGEAAERAFAALVERHGPMVLRVCRGVLADRHDAEDAFQATFLVLVQKAHALWVRDSLGPWLHQVAYRSASCARSAAARRRFHERRASGSAGESRVEVDDELGRVLHEEIDRLPDRYRAPMVLCDLGRQTYEQAARHLGWPIGTVQSRLSRGRERLRDRLRRRGLAPDAGLLAAAPGIVEVDASIPRALVECTTSAAVRFVTERAVLQGAAASLARRVLTSMLTTRLLKVALVLIALGSMTSGVTLLAQKGATGVGPRPAGNVGAARNDNLVLFAVEPGKLRVTTLEVGVIEPSRTAFVTCRVEGSRSIVSILREGSQVKKGQFVCELDSSALQGRLAELVAAGADQGAEATKLKGQVENCKLYAPIDGTIAHANDPLRLGGGPPQIQDGATVRERQIIFWVRDIDGPMQVNAKVREAVVDRIRPGMPTRTRLEPSAGELYAGAIFSGTVQDVFPLPNPRSVFSSREPNLYTAHVSIDNHPPGVRPGMKAQVEILLHELENVLAVPARAVLHYDGIDHAAVKRPDGGIDWREVTLGEHNDQYVEVKRGIKNGERVVVDPLALLSAKEKLKKLGAPIRPGATKPARPQRP